MSTHKSIWAFFFKISTAGKDAKWSQNLVKAHERTHEEPTVFTVISVGVFLPIFLVEVSII